MTAYKLAAITVREDLDCIGNARGLGCMNAVEITQRRGENKPDGRRAGAIIGAELENGLILVSAGPERNVIRIVVPLTASFDLVDEGLDILETAVEVTR